MHTHMLNMIISIANDCLMGNTYDIIAHTDVHACMCTCVYGTQHTSEHNHPPTPRPGGYEITKNQINLELIEIIKFCLKICNMGRLPQIWVGV